MEKIAYQGRGGVLTVLGGAATCSEGFVNCCKGCTAAAMLPKKARGTLRKLVTKPSEQVAAPPSILPIELIDSAVQRAIIWSLA